jgi:hypothetical protein
MRGPSSANFLKANVSVRRFFGNYKYQLNDGGRAESIQSIRLQYNDLTSHSAAAGHAHAGSQMCLTQLPEFAGRARAHVFEMAVAHGRLRRRQRYHQESR